MGTTNESMGQGNRSSSEFHRRIDDLVRHVNHKQSEAEAFVFLLHVYPLYEQAVASIYLFKEVLILDFIKQHPKLLLFITEWIEEHLVVFVVANAEIA